MTHVSADVQRITLNASCMTISGGRTKQLYIFCCITGFTSDFLSFVVVEHIRFFHGALQFVSLQGCITSLEEYISDHLIIIGAIGLGLCCLEVIVALILLLRTASRNC